MESVDLSKILYLICLIISQKSCSKCLFDGFTINLDPTSLLIVHAFDVKFLYIASTLTPAGHF